MTSERDNGKPDTLTRREAIVRVSSMFAGTALVGQAAMLAACSEAEKEVAEVAPANALFSNSDIALLDEIADTILPETDTPGAKAAGVGAFMAVMVTDCYYPPDQVIFKDGMANIDERCRETVGTDFLAADPAQRLALLETLDTEQFEFMRSKAPDTPAHYFRMMKELALLGYFTSEVGYTQAMRFVETPGRFDPCVPLEPGGTNWARHF